MNLILPWQRPPLTPRDRRTLHQAARVALLSAALFAVSYAPQADSKFLLQMLAETISYSGLIYTLCLVATALRPMRMRVHDDDDERHVVPLNTNAEVYEISRQLNLDNAGAVQ